MSQESNSPVTQLTVKTPLSADAREANLKLYDRVLATVSAIGLIAGGVWGLFTYANSKSNEARHRVEDLNRQVFNDRKEAYLRLVDAACEIVGCRDRSEVEKKSRAFLTLYAGRAHVIADPDSEVTQKKISFKNRLIDYMEGENKESKELPFHFFKDAALELTDACRKKIDPRTQLDAESFVAAAGNKK